MSEIKLDKNNPYFLIENIRTVAEKHWEYPGKLIEKLMLTVGEDEDERELINTMIFLKFLYIEPFVHGYKHRLEEEGIIK